MRLFVAIEIPDDVKNYLAKIQEELPKSMAKLRIVKKEQIHLTLKFLGEVEEGVLSSLMRALKKVDFEPFTTSLSSIGVFPSYNYVRVVWVGISPGEKVVELQNRIETSLESFSFKKDFKFHPHLTLARVAHVADKTSFAKSLQKIKVEPKQFSVDSFKLFKSTLTPQGPVYEELREFK